MNIHSVLTGAAVVLLLSSAPLPSSAQKIDTSKLAKAACSDLVYSQDFIGKYPKAPAACIEARVYKGQRYAKFIGKVYIPGKDVISVQILNVAGDVLTAVSFKPSPNARLLINGKAEAWGDLQKGDPVTFWVSEKRFAVFTGPGGSASAGVAPVAE
jgi:hypothetical protein